MTALLAFFMAAGLLSQEAGGSSAATRADLHLEPRSFRLELSGDFDGLLLGVGPATGLAARLAAMEWLRRLPPADEEARIEGLRELLRRRVRVRFDGRRAGFEVEFPERRLTAPGGRLLTLGSVARLRGEVPEGAEGVTVFVSRSFRGLDLRIHQGNLRSRQILVPGAESSPVTLR